MFRAASSLVPCLFAAQAVFGAQGYDVIIRGGVVHDGSGGAGVVCDVAVRGDRIAFVGTLPAEVSAPLVVDAAGRVVAPGFIDAHSHAGPGLADPERSDARALLAQGLTTVFINPDGFGPVDLPAQGAAIRRARPAVNAAPQIGHNSVRSAVLGQDARLPDAEELDRMRGLVSRAMEQGAFGLSSGPFYAPGSFSDTNEIAALALEVAPFGGFHSSHIRDEGDYSIGLVASVDEVIEVTRRTGAIGIVTHIKALGPGVWGASAEVIRRIGAARAEGLQIYADQYPYEASSTSLAAALVPRWAQEGGVAAMRKRLGDPALAERLDRDMGANLARRAGAGALQIRSCPAEPSLNGRRLDAIAAERGVEPLQLAKDLLRRGSVDVVSFIMHEEDILAFMRQPWTMTASDGDLPHFGKESPHPRSYGTFPRKLSRYVREQGVVTLERAIHSMTGQPAAVLGLTERGQLRPGQFADIVVFDLDEVRDTSAYDAPHAFATGMSWVFVNGIPAVRDGAFTDARAGRVLLRGKSREEVEALLNSVPEASLQAAHAEQFPDCTTCGAHTLTGG